MFTSAAGLAQYRVHDYQFELYTQGWIRAKMLRDASNVMRTV